jgi:hypothetical protein
LLCLLAFCLTAIVVYHWGRDRWRPASPGPAYTATAYVVERPHRAVAAFPNGTVPLSSNENWDRPQPVANQWPQLGDADAGQRRIPFVTTGDDPRQTAEEANALAEHYVANRGGQWRAQMEGPRLKAHEALETARQEYQASTARLTAFETQEREAAEAAAKAKPVSQASQPASSSSPPPSPPPPMIDNPRWLELRGRLAELQQRREKLLIDRTPMHPAVREIDVRIAEGEEKMAAVPRQIPAPTADGTRAVSTAGQAGGGAQLAAAPRLALPSVPSPMPDKPAVAPNSQMLDELTAAVTQARRACDEAELAEKRAVQHQQAGPQLAIEPAEAVQNPVQVDYGWHRLVWSALGSGMFMAFGLAVVSLGTSIQPPVASVAEVEAALGAAIIATIPIGGPIADLTVSARQTRRRRTAITIGVLLIVACGMVAVLGVMGI